MRRIQLSWSLNLTRILPISLKPSNLLLPPKYSTFLLPTHLSHYIPPPIADLLTRRDPVDLAAALTFSSTTNSLFLGSQIHSWIIKLGFCNHIFSQNNLLVMYTKCEALEHALNLFSEMGMRNLVSWTCMISGLVRSDQYEMSLEFYVAMLRSGLHPNEFTLASVLSACTAIEAVKFGCSLHAVSLKIGIDRNCFVGSSLLCMYAKCGNIKASEEVFECINYQDLTCWNAMVEGYALNGYSYDAMKTVGLTHQRGLTADQFTCISALKGCSVAREVNFGQQIHGFIIHNGFESSIAVMNALTDMYFRTGLNHNAMKVFNRIAEKDIVSWNTVISGFAQEDDEREVVVIFSKMLSGGLKPNHISFSILFRLCGAIGDLSLGLQFCCLAYHLGFCNDVSVVNSLLNMFSKCGLVESAYFLFSSFLNKNIITWNEMIAGYCLNGYGMDALKLLCNMVELGIRADEFTYSSILSSCHEFQDQKTIELIHAIVIKSCFDSCCFVCSSLINAYSKFGLVESSFKVFKNISILDLVSWGAMISAFSKQGLSYEALSLLNSLREVGVEPDEFILSSALNSCANSTSYKQCKCIHSHVIKTGYEKHLCVASAVVDAYGKSGDIHTMRQTFDYLSREDDAILYNTMIMAYAHHGLIMEAFEFFDRMKQANLYPSQATFVAVISACSHLGLVEQGKYFFDSMSSTYGMNPSRDNYACLVDLFARNGLLDKAKDVIEGMPFEPWPAIWRSLLSGCRIHGNKTMGELAAERILQLMPNNDGAYMLLSNAYAENGRWEDAAQVRMRMEERGIHKVAGYSIVDV